MASRTAAGAESDQTGARYSRVSIWFHWTIAALIIVNLAIGLLNDSLPGALRGTAMSFHKTAGIAVIFLSLARIAWRLANPAPPLSTHLKRWEKMLAHTTYSLFYVLMIAVPVAGWMFVSASTRPTALSAFGLFKLPRLPVHVSQGVSGFWREAHEVMAFGIIGLLLLHVAGALKHQLIDRDNELARMIPLLGRTRP